MIGKNILKIGLVVVLIGSLCNISYIPSAVPQDNHIPQYRALFFAPYSDDPPWKNDCKLFKRVLMSGGWEQNNIIQLENEYATEDNFMAALDYLANIDGSCDTLLLCILTHGDDDNFDAFLDYQGTNSIPYEDLNKKLDNLESAGIGIIIDACYSGNAIEFLNKEGRVIATSTIGSAPGLGRFAQRMAIYLDEIGDYFTAPGEFSGNRNGVVSIEEAYYNMVNEGYSSHDFWDWNEDESNQLHITFQDWTDGRIDQITGYTINSKGSNPVRTYNGGSCYNKTGQSFKPDMDKITKIRLNMDKNVGAHIPTKPIRISIRDDINGNDIQFKDIDPDDIDEFEKYQTIIFNDYINTPDPYYFIVCRTLEPEVNEDKFYRVYYHDECYTDGNCLLLDETDTDWVDYFLIDNEFIAYGKNNLGNLPPYVPKRPSGPVLGNPGVEYDYYVSATDLEGDQVKYMIDWGDEISQWMGPYSSGDVIEFSHYWTTSYKYDIRVKAKDIYDNVIDCPWSDYLTVTITSPPDAPEISGPTTGQAGVEYWYTFSTTDPENEDVYYKVVWGDGDFTDWIGPYSSGAQLNLPHTWENKGTYTVQAKAKDIHGAESDYSYLDVKMPFLYGHGCPQGTQITMVFGIPGGNTKLIEDIQIGDRILSYDPVNQVVTPSEVVNICEYIEHLPEDILLFNYNLQVTPRFNIFINCTEWMEADYTDVGYHMLENPLGSQITRTIPIFSKIEQPLGPYITIYDLEIQPLSGEASGYWANGILVGGYE